MTGYTRPAKILDLVAVSNAMRAEDAAEVMAQSGSTPREALLFCMLNSAPCQAMVSRNGHTIGMWGVIPEEDGVGRIWMLGTDGMVDDRLDRLTFLRQSKEVLDQLQLSYPLLFNVMDARNVVHKKWLQWLGFTFIAEHSDYGPERRLFLEFVRI